MTPSSDQPMATCPCRGTNLERLVRPACLIVLARGGQYGYRLVQELSALTIFGGQKPNTAGVYRCLRLLEEEGSVTSSWELTDRGPAKRQYSITPYGLECLKTWLRTLEDYQRAIESLIGLGHAVVETPGQEVSGSGGASAGGADCGCQCDCKGQ